MSLDPLKSRSLPPTDPPTVTRDEHAQRQEQGRSSDTPQVSGDSIQLSSRGPMSRVEEAGAVPQGTLSPERMQTVLRRLADGFYDRAAVRMEVARRVAPDIGNSGHD